MQFGSLSLKTNQVNTYVLVEVPGWCSRKGDSFDT